jgi:hypothetical protein
MSLLTVLESLAGSPTSISGGFNAIAPIIYTSVVYRCRARRSVRQQLNGLGAESTQSWEENQKRIVLAQ